VDRPTDGQIAAWYARLFRTAMRLTGNAEEAADLTQQAFCKALSRWGEFDEKALPVTWLHSILINCISDLARRRRVRGRETINHWDLVAVGDEQGKSLKQLERQEELAHLRGIIRNLPDTVRPAFVSTVLDGYSYLEASQLLGVPVGTVASRVYEARKQVAAAMRQRFPEG